MSDTCSLQAWEGFCSGLTGGSFEHCLVAVCVAWICYFERLLVDVDYVGILAPTDAELTDVPFAVSLPDFGAAWLPACEWCYPIEAPRELNEKDAEWFLVVYKAFVPL